MDVTIDNFEVVCQEIEALLPTCSFYCIDCEMTGIRFSKETDSQHSDTIDQRYIRMRKVASEFKVIQFGLALFHKDDRKPRSFLSRVYNFYLFPSGHATHILMETGAITFVKQYGMDFNKWIYKGISYLTAAGEQQLLMKLFANTEQKEGFFVREKKVKKLSEKSEEDESRAESRHGREVTIIDDDKPLWSIYPVKITKPEDKQVVDSTMFKIDQWVRSLREQDKACQAEVDKQLSAIVAHSAIVKQQRHALQQSAHAEPAPLSTEEKSQSQSSLSVGPVDTIGGMTKVPSEYRLPDTTSFLRRAILQRIEIKHPDLLIEIRESQVTSKKSAWLLKLSNDERKTRALRIKTEKEREFNKSLGFRRVFKSLVKSRKPLVGHNCLYDLLFMVSHFEAELPETASEFKLLIHDLFPYIFDTKHIVSFAPGRHLTKFVASNLTDVRELFTIVRAEGSIHVEFAPGFDKYTATAAAAAVTAEAEGTAPRSEATLTAPASLGIPDSQLHFHEAGFDAFATGVIFLNFYTNEMKRQFRDDLENQLHVLRCLYSFSFNPNLPDHLTHHGPILHVSGLPQDYQNSEILSLFGDAQPEIRWVDLGSILALFPDEASYNKAVNSVKFVNELKRHGIRSRSWQEFLNATSQAREAYAAEVVHV